MLRVPVDPDDPQTVTVGKTIVSSYLYPRYLFLGDRRASFQVRSSDMHSKPAKLPISVVHPDQTETDRHLSKDLSRIPSLYTMMQNQTKEGDPFCWPEGSTTFQVGKGAADGFQSQPTAPARCYGMPHEMQSIKSEDCSQFDVPAIHSEAHLRSFLDDNIYPGDSAIDIGPPTADTAVFMAASGPYLPSVTEREMISPNTSPDSSECTSEGGRHSLRGVEWLDNSVEDMPLSKSQGSSDVGDGGSTSAVEGGFMEVDDPGMADTVLRWPAFQVTETCDAACQGVSPSQSTWDTPRLSSMAQLYGDINSAFDRIVAVNDPSDGLPSFDSDNSVPLFSSYTSKSHYPPPVVPSNDGCEASQGCGQIFPGADLFQSLKSPYRINEPWQLQDLGGSNTFCPGQLMGRSLPYPIDMKNAFLINCKLRGMSYKEIKQFGGFKEAESTLRGRFRTLTKTKEQRVRKPHWHEKDIQLLCEAVAACSETGKQPTGYASYCRPRSVMLPPKVSWKKVAQYISANGGSYHFGNATCKKKWCSVYGVKL
ncbi:hypothetical protein BO70DRAFT_426931 [Aspergillus heteromorphus CBS 117.55]|uniref:Myb-like domain-containing protein n=1 Tax=Aspergillus heteromorphus CBS 117.55 TaxID=1448321 RepID=A0A317WSF7_9EURO|nr:uncharacterized protein BO70DRAFT_426931 [Aspergillus heteromorphus CBS 117.55]PWY89309.1 hypothetical protein BO70DRAFT_426931 [Aspergillus heteromorphus CBS 117.55]